MVRPPVVALLHAALGAVVVRAATRPRLPVQGALAERGMERPRCAGARPKLYVYRLPRTLTGELEICPQAAQEVRTPLARSAPGGRLPSQRAAAPACAFYENYLYDRELPLRLRQHEQTVDPAEAELFYVPAHLTMMYFAKRFPGNFSCPFCERRDAEIVAFMREVGPFWDRFGGADHLVDSLTCTYQKGAYWFNSFKSLWGGNTLRACLEENMRKHDANAIKVPYYYARPEEPVLLAGERDIPIFFAGSAKRTKGRDRTWIPTALASISGSSYMEVTRTGEDHTQLISRIDGAMRRAKFAVVPAGDTPESLRLQQAIMLGAIPVIVSDFLWLPLEEHVDWGGFVIRLKERDVQRDPSLLQRTVQDISGDTLAEMQARMLQARLALSYTNERGAVPDLVLMSACKRMRVLADS